MIDTTYVNIDDLTRAVEAGASLEQDLVHYAAPVLAGVKPAAMFAYPFTRKTREEITVDVPQVLLLGEFCQVLQQAQNQLDPEGVVIHVLAWRESSALLFIYRPTFAAATLMRPGVRDKLEALGYTPNNFAAALDELTNRMATFDALEGQRDFWDFPHEVGYFLGYPPADVMAYVRNRGGNYTTSGEWNVYGCHKRAHAMMQVFESLRACTLAYWNLYLEGATLAQLATLGSLNCPA